jgi:hypothetical protein
VAEFHLCSSVIRPEGAAHEIEETYPLDGFKDAEVET